MRLIKRYPNRKLYDTQTRTYITLEGVATLVAEGVDIKVVDNETSEDLTTIILSQLLLERERSRRSLSSGLLSGLLRSGESLSRGISNLAWPLPVAPVSWLGILEHEVERSLKFWLDMAQGSEEEVLRVIEGLVDKRRKARTFPESPRPTPPGLKLLRRRDLDDFENWDLPPGTTEGDEPSSGSAEVTALAGQVAEQAQRLAHHLSHLREPELLRSELLAIETRLSEWLNFLRDEPPANPDQ